MYEHYIALDWAQDNMAIAKMTAKSNQIKVMECPTDLTTLKDYLKNLRGEVIFTIEETTGSQWLYTELKSLVAKIIVCDPHRNKLLSEGAKNDRIDASKLVQLLKAGLLKEVYHSGEEFIYLRTLTSGYEDLVKGGVRLKNQRSAIFKSKGQDHKKDVFQASHLAEDFVLSKIDKQIINYETQKKEYEEEFSNLSKKHKLIQLLKRIPGIGDITAVQIVVAVVDPRRFESKGKFLSYCGLVTHDKMSGGRFYGKRRTRHCPLLKRIFKLSSKTVTRDFCNNPLREFYEYLIFEKKKAPHNASHAVARRLAVLAYGVLKTEKKFDPTLRGKKIIAS